MLKKAFDIPHEHVVMLDRSETSCENCGNCKFRDLLGINDIDYCQYHKFVIWDIWEYNQNNDLTKVGCKQFEPKLGGGDKRKRKY